MKKDVLEFVTQKSKELIEAKTCSAEAREAAEQWMNAVGTELEAEETKKYIAELEEDIVTVEGLEAFAESEMGAKVFGVDAVSYTHLMCIRDRIRGAFPLSFLSPAMR